MKFKNNHWNWQRCLKGNELKWQHKDKSVKEGNVEPGFVEVYLN
jgi:hypothetical protein